MRLRLHYEGALLIPVMAFDIDQRVSDDAHASQARITSTGVISLLFHIDERASSRGAVRGGVAEPGAFEFQHQAGKTHRRVTTEWRADRVASTAVPPFKSLGEPPASEADKRLAADPLTRLVQMTGLTAPETACRRSYTFFDGKQLYAVDLSNPRPAQAAPLSALASPTLCDGAYRQIAGFGRPKPGQEDHGLKSRISLTFGRVGPAGPWVLAEVSARTKLGSARIVLRSVRLGDQPAG